MTVRILVVSDVRVVQEGVRAVLTRRDGIDVVGSVDMLHARAEAERLHADVILVDAARHDSVEFVRAFVAAAPRSKVVGFGVKETDEEILALAAAGTAGYLRESAESADVARMLRQVLSDELPCSPRAAASLYRQVAMLSQGVTDPASAAPRRRSAFRALPLPLSRRDLPVSRRELQIAHLIDRGLTNKQIARQLGIEAATVKNHVHHLCEKLEVHRRSEATARIRALLQAQAATRPRAEHDHQPPSLA
jgi:two-component system, NarL family, nitrate/nitrite response regulator NarL